MTTLNPASPGTSLGRRFALMREQVLPPGALLRTKLVWVRCRADHRDCTFKGNILVCGRCWDERKKTGDVVIHGSLESPLAVVCESCGGRDSEVTGYGEASGAECIAEWNAEINQRIEREVGMNATCSCGHDAENHGWFGCGKCNCTITRKNVR